MNRPEDNFTSTVDGAAAFERHHSRDVGWDDRPDWSDVAEPEYEVVDLEEPQSLLEAQMDEEEHGDE